jgi:hypothetical protein
MRSPLHWLLLCSMPLLAAATCGAPEEVDVDTTPGTPGGACNRNAAADGCNNESFCVSGACRPLCRADSSCNGGSCVMYSSSLLPQGVGACSGGGYAPGATTTTPPPPQGNPPSSEASLGERCVSFSDCASGCCIGTESGGYCAASDRCGTYGSPCGTCAAGTRCLSITGNVTACGAICEANSECQSDCCIPTTGSAGVCAPSADNCARARTCGICDEGYGCAGFQDPPTCQPECVSDDECFSGSCVALSDGTSVCNDPPRSIAPVNPPQTGTGGDPPGSNVCIVPPAAMVSPGEYIARCTAVTDESNPLPNFLMCLEPSAGPGIPTPVLPNGARPSSMCFRVFNDTVNLGSGCERSGAGFSCWCCP